ncbi:hypothetical protein BDN71DRAFT_1450868 [Pleurotus eryngii]|uniref:F-box domain-containing protein n=1 Tax=Pleurotus eryngii TaxID=5323 RepID=A0A9P5ZRN9_PLEER|nr:hypothetical protein BDN71DRAFT_1450868 [Pleurotus eryngii]
MLMLTIANPLRRHGINKLPFELLGEIFKLASTDRFLYEERTVPPACTLVALSHVCGTWRTIIRGAPQLWTIVCGVEPPAMIREIVTLSQKMPLLIMLVEKKSDNEDEENDGQEHRDEDEDETEEWLRSEDNGDDENVEGRHGIERHDDEDKADELHGVDDHGSSDGESDDEGDSEADNESDGSDDSGSDDDAYGVTPRNAAEIILAQLHRIATLHISLNSEDAPTLLPLLDANTPRLQVVGGDAPIVVNPFRGTAPPRLTMLSLTGGCELSQISTIWTKLTHLYLYSEPDKAHREPYQSDGGFVHLSSALAQMSSLVDLDIRGAIPPDICNFALSEIQAIDLPRLISLTIRDFASKCFLFLSALKCPPDTLTVAAGEDDDYADYEHYESRYYYLFQMCQQQMAAVFKRNPVSHITLENKPDEFLVKGFRSQEGVPGSAFGNPLTIEILHSQPSFVNEELVSRAINIFPARQPHKLGVELKNINDLDLTSVAWNLHTLEGISCNAISIDGHEAHWWASPEDELSVSGVEAGQGVVEDEE